MVSIGEKAGALLKTALVPMKRPEVQRQEGNKRRGHDERWRKKRKGWWSKRRKIDAILDGKKGKKKENTAKESQKKDREPPTGAPCRRRKANVRDAPARLTKNKAER